MKGATLFDPQPPLIDTLRELIQTYGYNEVRHELILLSPVQAVPSAPARSTDPTTSHEAGPRSHDVSRFGAKSRQAKLLAVFATQPLTDQQATVRVVGASAVPSAFDGCRRRCSDLRAAGYVVDSGRRRKNPGSDDFSVVWEITLAGMDAIRSLDRFGWSR